MTGTLHTRPDAPELILPLLGDIFEYPGCRQDKNAIAGRARKGWRGQGLQQRVRCVRENVEKRGVEGHSKRSHSGRASCLLYYYNDADLLYTFSMPTK